MRRFNFPAMGCSIPFRGHRTRTTPDRPFTCSRRVGSGETLTSHKGAADLLDGRLSVQKASTLARNSRRPSDSPLSAEDEDFPSMIFDQETAERILKIQNGGAALTPNNGAITGPCRADRDGVSAGIELR